MTKLKYKGICHKCGEMVVKGKHVRIKGSWRTEHLICPEEVEE